MSAECFYFQSETGSGILTEKILKFLKYGLKQ